MHLPLLIFGDHQFGNGIAGHGAIGLNRFTPNDPRERDTKFFLVDANFLMCLEYQIAIGTNVDNLRGNPKRKRIPRFNIGFGPILALQRAIDRGNAIILGSRFE